MRFKLSAILPFLAMVALIGGSSLYFTGSQLARAFVPGTPGVWGAWAWAVALWGFPLMRVVFFRERVVSRTQSLAFFLLGLGATVVVLLLLYKAASTVLGLAGYSFPTWGPWVILSISVLLAFWGWRQALAPAVITRHKVTVAGLHAGLQGLRIVQISDLHVSHLLGKEPVAQLVGQVMELKPDLIAVTGDLVDGPLRSLLDDVQPLAGLKAPLGVHYVTGNHEYFWGAEAWMKEFRTLGFQVLDNEHRVVERDGAKLLVVGVNDPTAQRMGFEQGPDLAKAMAGAPKADFTLFLAHQPQAYVMAETADADLFLAGHTHGGQFFPFPPIVGLFHRYFRGLHRHGAKLWVYVHSGSGFWGPPNRLGVPPEIALIELERA